MKNKGYLIVNDFKVKLGSLYTLYLLYETQPPGEKKIYNQQLYQNILNQNQEERKIPIFISPGKNI